MFRTTTFVEGVVIDTNDPQQMGRFKAWCPAVDGENKDAKDLPWVRYVSPFAGQTLDFPAGAEGKPTNGYHSFGMWAIPKKSATVIIGFLYGDMNKRFYIGSFFPDHGNRSLPTGRNAASGPVTDTLERLEPQLSNLKTQFNGNLSASEAQTRGAYERQVAQAADTKDGTEGYQADVVEKGELDPQTYCITTPGRHSIIMQDNPTTGRVRIKTAEGHQVILDDANERIYVSTAKGNAWFEMDQDGHIHVYGAESFSVTSEADINFTAKKNINLYAGGSINLSAVASLRGSACADLSLTGEGKVGVTSGGKMDLLAGGVLMASGSKIHLNGPKAEKAACPDKTSIIPQHEPWTRPATKGKRNKNWKA